MITVRRANERGHANFGWLNSFHTFSFGEYHDPNHMSFRTLRVINDDTVQPANGFGEHPHRDMEIISYVIDGELEHKDSLGHGAVLKTGEVQAICAGTGITHSEFNPSKTKAVHFLQIWILPGKKGLKPRYQQEMLSRFKNDNGLTLFVSNREEDQCLIISQDAKIYHGKLKAGQSRKYQTSKDRGLWIQMINGNITVGENVISQGDGISIEQTTEFTLESISDSEFLLFDLK
ncbi:MAG: pirin family protein [Candidatus Omnitrophica bacterium]|nr:pirin family protein [Candidatus Omnitrophota bacterium]